MGLVGERAASRLFEYLVVHINSSMEMKSDQLLNTIILGHHDFEIFDQNGFRQFCVNYVNKTLQQIYFRRQSGRDQKDKYQFRQNKIMSMYKVWLKWS